MHGSPLLEGEAQDPGPDPSLGPSGGSRKTEPHKKRKENPKIQKVL